jgi:hypothetical protein
VRARPEDLAVMLAAGGDCLADLAVVRDQDALFGRGRVGLGGVSGDRQGRVHGLGCWTPCPPRTPAREMGDWGRPATAVRGSKFSLAGIPPRC